MNRIHGEIDRLLAERRPDRYDREGGDEWLDEIAHEVAALIPEAEAQSLHASKLVRDREKSKTQIANRLVREMASTRQPPLGWLETLPYPLAVSRKERVALRAMTANDFREFANNERRDAARELVTRNETSEGAEWFADEMDAHGWRFFSEFDFFGL